MKPAHDGSIPLDDEQDQGDTLEEHAVAWWKNRGFRYWDYTEEERKTLYEAWAIIAFTDIDN